MNDEGTKYSDFKEPPKTDALDLRYRFIDALDLRYRLINAAGNEMKVVQSGVQSGPSTSYSMGLDGKHTLESRNPDGTVLSHQEWGPMTGGPWSEGWKHNATALYRVTTYLAHKYAIIRHGTEQAESPKRRGSDDPDGSHRVLR